MEDGAYMHILVCFENLESSLEEVLRVVSPYTVSLVDGFFVPFIHQFC
jgi:hypothetical protein